MARKRQHAHRVQPTLDAMRRAGASRQEIAAEQRRIDAARRASKLTPAELQRRQELQRSAGTLTNDGKSRQTRTRSARNKAAINDS